MWMPLRRRRCKFDYRMMKQKLGLDNWKGFRISLASFSLFSRWSILLPIYCLLLCLSCSLEGLRWYRPFGLWIYLLVLFWLSPTIFFIASFLANLLMLSAFWCVSAHRLESGIMWNASFRCKANLQPNFSTVAAFFLFTQWSSYSQKFALNLCGFCLVGLSTLNDHNLTVELSS